jgi:hypothetical protein
VKVAKRNSYTLDKKATSIITVSQLVSHIVQDTSVMRRNLNYQLPIGLVELGKRVDQRGQENEKEKESWIVGKHSQEKSEWQTNGT